MELVVPAGCAGRSVSLTVGHVRRSRRQLVTFTSSATLSPLRGGEAAVDWVEATSSFFEKDTRPIMLFDGKKLLRRSGRAPDDISSVVLVEKESFIRDFAYDNVANNRYTIFGRSDSCEL
ncbi:putative thiol-disulfide oxidoreductase DCC [Actinidia rufa]|uniref:Putative thiol-disulfide oxidoreductase DCC n=1 Tax=Actinidia rufa TaxID=165716 RepID=A0A7J0FE47_9ERIC|nr:putative thiol-disulfide oxidoreductase DCC [Actinidia rufa]